MSFESHKIYEEMPCSATKQDIKFMQFSRHNITKFITDTYKIIKYLFCRNIIIETIEKMKRVVKKVPDWKGKRGRRGSRSNDSRPLYGKRGFVERNGGFRRKIRYGYVAIYKQ